MKKKSHSIFAVLALALVIAAAIVVFALIRKYTPSKEHEDLTTYYHLTNSDEVAIVLNNEVTSSKARVIDGHIYICLLYTSPSPRDPKTSRMPSSA